MLDKPRDRPPLQKIAERMAVAIGEKLEQVIKGEECKVLNLTEVVYELLRTHFGAAQEVSPLGWCCKHCYDGGYQAAMRLLAEGDTQEERQRQEIRLMDADMMAVTNCEKLRVCRETRAQWQDRAKKAEGDTRELKAALTEAEKIVLGLIDKTATQEIVIREAQRAMVRWRVLLG